MSALFNIIKNFGKKKVSETISSVKGKYNIGNASKIKKIKLKKYLKLW